MQIEMFLSNLVVTVSVVTLAMLYLRHATRKVIRDLCHTDTAAEFWLRSTDVLAYSGALMLVLMGIADYEHLLVEKASAVRSQNNSSGGFTALPKTPSEVQPSPSVQKTIDSSKHTPLANNDLRSEVIDSTFDFEDGLPLERSSQVEEI